jgi:GT2 family glycosyltransferase
VATVLHQPREEPRDPLPCTLVTDIAVVIVSFNSAQTLKPCLDSLLAACEGISAQYFVVDNGSSDGCAELVRNQYPSIKLIANPSNRGFANANNQALKNAAGTSRYFLLLNPDTRVDPAALRTMIAFMEANRDVGMAGCKVMKPDGSLDWACKRSYITPAVLFYKALGLDTRHPKHPKYGTYHLTYLDEDQVHEVDALVGAFMLVRAECLQEIGLLDESFFMYGEDLEWCYRAKAHGWKIFYVPTATVVHDKGQSSAARSYRSIFYWYHCTWMAYRKTIAPRYSWLTNGLVWLGFHGMCVVSLVANFFRAEKRVPGRL